MNFREKFRDSLIQNPSSKFNTHWESAMTSEFGNNPPCNAATQHLIFEDKVKRNFYYYNSRMPSTENAFISHYALDGQLLNERFIYEHDKMIFYMLPSYLKLLAELPVTADGTWSPVRYLKYKQMYVLTVQYRKNDKLMTIPLVYCLTLHFSQRSYNSFFDFIKHQYQNQFGEKLIIRELHLDMEQAVVNSARLNFPNIIIVFCFVHILRAFSRRCKTNLGNHFYKDKLLLEYFKTVSGCFFLNHKNKPLITEMKSLLDSFQHRAPAKSRAKRGLGTLNNYLNRNYFGARARFPFKNWDYHTLILTNESFQLSTNGIESINRSLKHYLGLGMCHQERLDREMKLYHQQKINVASAALKHGRMKNIRRQKLAHQDSLFKSMNDFERLSDQDKIRNLRFHILDCGTYTSEHCNPQFFDVLPMLDELDSTVNEPLISEKSMLENSLIDDIPPLETVPELCEIPSFLGTDFGDREVQKSGRRKVARYDPIH